MIVSQRNEVVANLVLVLLAGHDMTLNTISLSIND